MSVFKKLKGSFQTAQQGLFDGLRSVTLFDGHLKSDQLQHVKSKEIDLNAGADILHEYQETWAAIRNDTKVCSEKAESVDCCLSPMFLVWDQRAESVTELEEEVKSIPFILSTFKDMHSLIENLRQEFSVVESALNVLENLCEEQELRKAMADETKKLKDYKTLKDIEAEKIKVSLAQSHVRRMQDVESNKNMKLKERAEAFTSAFEEDVDYYKTYGQPEGKLVTEFPKVSSLSQIEIEEDNKELDSFLGPEIEEEQKVVGGGEEEEEQYFEDDYTADFSIKKDDEDISVSAEERKKSFTSSGESLKGESILQNKGAYPSSYLLRNEEEESGFQEDEGENDQEELKEEKTVVVGDMDSTSISSIFASISSVKDDNNSSNSCNKNNDSNNDDSNSKNEKNGEISVVGKDGEKDSCRDITTTNTDNLDNLDSSDGDSNNKNNNNKDDDVVNNDDDDNNEISLKLKDEDGESNENESNINNKEDGAIDKAEGDGEGNENSNSNDNVKKDNDNTNTNTNKTGAAKSKKKKGKNKKKSGVEGATSSGVGGHDS